MTITFGLQGTISSGTVALVPAYPVPTNAGELLLLYVVNKYSPNLPSPTPTGWSLVGQATGGAGVAGLDSGTASITVFSRTADGTETGTVSVAIPGGNSGVAKIDSRTKSTPGPWLITSSTGANNVASTAWAVTADADLGCNVGDRLLAVCAVNTDSTRFTIETWVAAGATFGAHSERYDTGTTQGDDCGLLLDDTPITSGPSTGPATFSATGDVGAPSGACVFVLLREPPPSTGSSEKRRRRS